MKSTRRSFLAGSVGVALSAQVASAKSRVVIARDPKAPVPALLDRAVQAFFDRNSPGEAWKQLVRPGERIGLKVNCLSGKGNATSVSLVNAICERLQQAGVKPENIIIWDRLNEDLESAGFRVSTSSGKTRCLGNDVLGYEDELSVFGSVGSLVAKNLTQACDAVINLPVLKDHGIVGVTMALKNMFGAIHNPNKYHPNGGDPYVADVNALPEIRKKLRLTICDGTTAQYEGGPTYMPQWTWPYGGLLVAKDPVALDTLGWQIIEQKRAEKGMRPLKEMKREPKYIATAADGRHALGTNDPSRIEKVEV